MKTILMVALILIIIWNNVEASDFKIGLFSRSHHHNQNTFDCLGIDKELNENNPGLYVIYHGVMIGRYENSHSGCGDSKYSNLIGYETELNEYFSITAGIADGYINDDGESDRYMPFASINGKLGPFKVWYGYTVTAISLEYSF